jgi:hypothetical protein
VRTFNRAPSRYLEKIQGKLTDKSPAEPKAPVKPAESKRVKASTSSPPAEREAKRLSLARQRKLRQARLGALAWLKGTYPSVFCYPPRPLAIGVGKVIFIAAKAAGIENHPVRAALSFWTRSHSYQLALTAPGAMRCTLNGAEIELVDAQHIAEARKRLEEIAARKAAKRQPRICPPTPVSRPAGIPSPGDAKNPPAAFPAPPAPRSTKAKTGLA